MFSRNYDETTSVLRVKASGQPGLIETTEHIQAMKQLISDLRERAVPIRVLVDVRDVEPMGLEIEAAFRELKKDIYGPGDRVAILTNDIDHKEHMRSMLSGGEIWWWSSEFVAEEWLLLDGLRMPPPAVWSSARPEAH